MTAVDEKAQALWEQYTEYKEVMLKHTDTQLSPWTIVDANHKISARINSLKHILERIPYTKA